MFPGPVIWTKLTFVPCGKRRASAFHDVDRRDVVDELHVVRDSRIEEPPPVAFADVAYGDHAQFDLAEESFCPADPGGVESVRGVEEFGFAADSEVLGEEREATGAVSAHLAFGAVGVEVAHRTVDLGVVSEGHQSVGSDPEMAVAQSGDPLRRGREEPFAVVDQDEVVSGSFVFCKFQLHHSDV